MRISKVLNILEEFESLLETMYKWFSDLFADDEEASTFFSRMSEDEKSHVQLVKLQRRLVLNNPKMFENVDIDLEEIERLTSKVKEMKNPDSPPTIKEAVGLMVEIESHSSECYYRSAIEQSNKNLSRLILSLGKPGRAHTELDKFVKKWGFELTTANGVIHQGSKNAHTPPLPEKRIKG